MCVLCLGLNRRAGKVLGHGRIKPGYLKGCVSLVMQGQGAGVYVCMGTGNS